MAGAALTLASGSPQRRAILEQLGLDFTVVEPGAQERTDGEAQELVLANALAKARSVHGELVLGADTAVELEGRVLGKPRDESEARSYLRLLEGRMHRVWSGLALVRDGDERLGTSATNVCFRALDPRDIDWYVETGEWRGRAGAYAIQGVAATFVSHLSGSYSGVMGLPLYETGKLLREFGLDVREMRVAVDQIG